MTEAVHHPSHYRIFPDKEAIELIKACLTHEEFIGWLKGDILKYRLRAGFKDDVKQDIDKAMWYQNYLFEYVEAHNVQT